MSACSSPPQGKKYEYRTANAPDAPFPSRHDDGGCTAVARFPPARLFSPLCRNKRQPQTKPENSTRHPPPRARRTDTLSVPQQSLPTAHPRPAFGREKSHGATSSSLPRCFRRRTTWNYLPLSYPLPRNGDTPVLEQVHPVKLPGRLRRENIPGKRHRRRNGSTGWDARTREGRERFMGYVHELACMQSFKGVLHRRKNKKKNGPKGTYCFGRDGRFHRAQCSRNKARP